MMKKSAGVILVLSLLIGLFLITSSCKGKKEKPAVVAGPLPETAYFVEFMESQIPATLKPGESRKVPVTIKNLGDTSWPHLPGPEGGYEVNLAYHWLDDKGNVIIWDGDRTSMPFDLLPGAQVTLEANVRAPEKPGKYKIQFQMVQEKVAWFGDDKGADTLTADVEIKGLMPTKPVSEKKVEKQKTSGLTEKAKKQTRGAKAKVKKKATPKKKSQTKKATTPNK
ncbi:MAG: hypothetical protein A3G93_07010 [Nitrospinae bacterium RIFCSPLOWO2_12_FULL_45_22]|nr:MAG: hypothetical protein A3G93_07010 [Nitrospinae bacterium RIFCSPLOWO2_12_FULL_45_22]